MEKKKYVASELSFIAIDTKDIMTGSGEAVDIGLFSDLLRNSGVSTPSAMGGFEDNGMG